MLYTIYNSMHRYIYELVYYIITIRTTRILYESILARVNNNK